MLKSQKPHIGIFGRTNVGKSSLMNCLMGQNICITDKNPGTTTDAVHRHIEMDGVGPVVLIDTAGIADSTIMGEKRVFSTKKVMDQVDLALVVFAHRRFENEERELLKNLQEKNIPIILIHNQEDILPLETMQKENLEKELAIEILLFFTIQNKSFPDSDTHSRLFKALLGKIATTLPKKSTEQPSILGDLIQRGDVVLLVTPIDLEAPKGRLILPQIQTIRDILDNDAICIVLKERELDSFFERHTIKPKLVVTDSQAFLKVDASVPKDIPLTSFSILFARIKGDFTGFLQGTPAIDTLKDKDRILILESCSHHVSGDDIGRVKIPRWISRYTGKELEFDVIAGLDHLDREITDYSLVIQCGGCMLTKTQVMQRIKKATDKEIPISNYGMTIAWCLGIFHRAVAPFVITQEEDSL